MSEKTAMRPVTVQLVDEYGGFSAGVDKSTAALQTIEYPHHEIHEGSAFVVSANETLASSGTIALSFHTGDTAKWSHMTYFARASGEANIQIIENPTITLGTGTAKLSINRNRNSAKTSLMQDSSTGAWVAGSLTQDATVAGGTVICEEHFGSGQATGGSTVNRSEFMLKQDEDYVYLLTSEAAGNDCELILNWYEHTDKA